MEEKKDIEIQEDEPVKEPKEKPETEAKADQTAAETEKTSDEELSRKRHKGRHERNKAALEEAHAKYAELNNTYLRLYSEFDNYRKRTAKEKLELQNMEKSGNEADLQGVTLIYNKFKSTLQKRGLEEIVALDCEFNTDEHEALTMIPAPDESKKGKVIDVIQKGYKLNGTVIRFARVVVGS